MSPHVLRSLAFVEPQLPQWHDERVAVAGGSPLTLRIYGAAARQAANDTLPLVLHFHGGAFTGGSLAEGGHVAEALAASGAVVASIDYPLAPDFPFPHAIEAGHAALRWLERERKRLAGAKAPLYVAGEDAGANIAAGLAMMARDRGGPALAGQLLLSPMLDACVGTKSQRDARAGPVGCPCADGWRAYLSGDADVMHPYAAPAASLRLGGLPPTLLVTATDDPLRDEARAFAQRLQQAGVPARLHVVPAPTGWPLGLHQPLSESCANALRTPVRAFFSS